MTEHPDRRSELDALADRYCAGDLGEADAARLSDLLRGDPTAQRRFLEFASLHAGLVARHSGTLPAVPPARPASAARLPRPRLWWRLWAGAGMAAAAALAFAVLLAPPWATPAPAAVALLRDTVDARWPDAVERPPGSPLPAGRLTLDAGVAEIAFAGGAVAVLEGPAEIELLDAGAAFLHRGGVVVRVPAEVAGFRLDTPAARLSDLGTEFGVRVGGPGDAVLQVYEGEVLAELKLPAGPREHRIESGRAVALAGDAAEVPFVPERFVRVLPGPDDPRGRGKQPYNRSRFDTVHVVQAPAPPTVDGDLSDWDLSGRFRAECEPPYGENHFLEAAMMYDHRFLYVAARVGDPFPMRSVVSPDVPRERYGMGGGVALRISTDRRMGWPARGTAPWSTARRGRRQPEDVNDMLAFLMLWHHRPDGRACLQIRYGMDLHGARVNPPGYRGAFRPAPDGRGYVLEYAIPWELLNAADDPPRAGDVLAATWLAHWSDPAGRVWKGQLIEVRNPADDRWNIEFASTWGRAVYHGPGPLPPGTVRGMP